MCKKTGDRGRTTGVKILSRPRSPVSDLIIFFVNSIIKVLVRKYIRQAIFLPKGGSFLVRWREGGWPSLFTAHSAAQGTISIKTVENAVRLDAE
jgi:hypothetical protein